MSYLNLHNVISQLYLSKNKDEYKYAIKKGKEGVLRIQTLAHCNEDGNGKRFLVLVGKEGSEVSNLFDNF